MAFTSKEEDGAFSQKQHLNLSALANEVIKFDMFAFGAKTTSGFLNRVFENYYSNAEASIGLKINSFKDELQKLFDTIPVCGNEETKKAVKKTKEHVIEKLISHKEDELLQTTKLYGKGEGWKFSLNRKNYEYLSEPDGECRENEYYPSRGKYIKSVLEEYARLPYVEREKIYYSKSFVEKIDAAICMKKQLRVVTEKDKVYSVYPYAILRDSLSTANYLTGYCTRHDDPDGEKRTCSFRISALKSIEIEKSKSAFLKEDIWKELAQKIASRGVQFMAEEEAEVRVRLTENGANKFRRQTHLRPPLIERNGDLYVFQCTKAQAEFYFFKFGGDAEILFPLDLRERFKSMYEFAANKYQKY